MVREILEQNDESELQLIILWQNSKQRGKFSIKS